MASWGELVWLAKLVWSVMCGTFCDLFFCFYSRRSSQPPNLRARVCVVTGAGQGLGRHLALQLAGECGATLVLWDINEEKVHAVAREIREGGGEAHSYVVDCSKREEVYRAAATVREEVGDVAVLVNNAALASAGSYVEEKISDEQIEKTFSVNILALFWTIRAFLPHMMEKDCGHIVNIASIAAHVGTPYLATYASTKAAVKSFSESLRCELQQNGKSGISVTCAYPSYMDTDMIDAGTKERFRAKNVRISQPEDVARAVLCGMEGKEEEIFISPFDRFIIFMKNGSFGTKRS